MVGIIIGSWNNGPGTNHLVCVDQKVHLVLEKIKGESEYSLASSKLAKCDGRCKVFCELPADAEEAVNDFLRK